MDKVENRILTFANFENLLVWLHWHHCDVGKVAQGAFACTRSTVAVYSTICAASVAYKAAKGAKLLQFLSWTCWLSDLVMAALAALYATETACMVLYTAVVLLVHAKAPCATFPASHWCQWSHTSKFSKLVNVKIRFSTLSIYKAVY